MGKTHVTPSPTLQRSMVTMGENIRLARLRRNLSAKQVAERAGITPPTLRAIEHGEASVSFGNLASVLFSLGFDRDLATIAQDDELGRKLQDLNISVGRRAKRRTRQVGIARQTPSNQQS
jgi:transcriptional regulator with XRE-family HTH domain